MHPVQVAIETKAARFVRRPGSEALEVQFVDLEGRLAAACAGEDDAAVAQAKQIEPSASGSGFGFVFNHPSVR